MDIKIHIKNILKNFSFKNAFEFLLYSRWYILVIGVILLLKTIFFYSNTVFYNDEIWFWSIRQTCLFIFILVCPLLLIRRSIIRFEIGLILNFIISMLLFMDELYFTYSSNILSILQISNFQYTEEIIDVLPTLLSIRQFIYFIDIIIILVLIFSKFVKIKYEKNFKIVPIIIVLPIIILFCVSYHLIPESLELVNGYNYSKYNSVRYGTIYGYHYIDIVNAITNKRNIKYNNYEDMLMEYSNIKEYKDSYKDEYIDYTGIAKGKNVFIIQLESIQEFVINKMINGKEITPNINKFLKENVNVTNMHSSSYTTTADSEYSFITSLYPIENGEVFSKYYNNISDDIFGKMKTAGYINIFVHGNDDNFWNRKTVYTKYDVDNVYFIDSFKDTSERIMSYLSDELLYKQIFDMIDNDNNNPIFVDLVAASSHKPFDLDGIINKEEKVLIDVGKYKSTQLGNYLEAVNYADYAFGIFIDKMKENGYYDDSVIFIYGDHYGMSMYDNDLINFLGEDEDKYNDSRLKHIFSNVACGIRIPGLSGLKIDYPVSKIDIKPTICQILGIEDKFSLGTSILYEKPYVCINNGNIIMNDYYYDMQDWYNLSDGEIVDLNSIDINISEIMKKNEECSKKEIDISNSVIWKNLLKEKIN